MTQKLEYVRLPFYTVRKIYFIQRYLLYVKIGSAHDSENEIGM